MGPQDVVRAARRAVEDERSLSPAGELITEPRLALPKRKRNKVAVNDVSFRQEKPAAALGSVERHYEPLDSVMDDVMRRTNRVRERRVGAREGHVLS